MKAAIATLGRGKGLVYAYDETKGRGLSSVTQQFRENTMTPKNHQEQKASDMQVELLTKAMEKAVKNDGLFLNAEHHVAPSLFPRGKSTAGFNSLILGLRADESSYKTGVYTLFNEAKKADISIKQKEHGIPVMFTKWDTYANVKNPEVTVSKDEYKAMSQADQALYRPKPTRELRTLFNLDQTTMSAVKKEDYEAIVKQKGNPQDRGLDTKKDTPYRTAVNDFLVNIKTNLVDVKLDSTGLGHYDAAKDKVLLPKQSKFENYEEYAQELLREVVSATGHQERLARQGVEVSGGKMPEQDKVNRERLIVELASAVKMQEMGMAARLSPESQALVPEWTKAMKEDPCYLDNVAVSVNTALDVIAKAQRGEKVEYASVRNEQQTAKLAEAIGQKGKVAIDNIQMMKDDNNRWTVFIKPEGQPGFNLYPEHDDLNRFFTTIKKGPDEAIDKLRAELGQKYYAMGTSNPQLKVDLFGKDTPQADLDRIDKVSIFRAKDERLLILPTIDGTKQKARELTPTQWQRMWLSDDMARCKAALAANVYKDVLHPELAQQQNQEQQQEQQQKEKTEQAPVKESEKKEEKKKEEKEKEAKEKAKQETVSPILKQYLDLKKKHPDALLLFRCGDFYESYMDDAKKASNILNLTLTRNNKLKDPEGKPLAMAGFPYHALDTYLPKLIRAGERVAICDQIENHKKQSQVSEMVSKADPKPEVKQDEEQEQHRGMHR